jgi:hypothetical protein
LSADGVGSNTGNGFIAFVFAGGFSSVSCDFEHDEFGAVENQWFIDRDYCFFDLWECFDPG